MRTAMTRFSAATSTLAALSLALSLGACKKIDGAQDSSSDDTYVIETQEVTESADGNTKTVTITRSKDGSTTSTSTSTTSSASASASSGDGENVSLSFSEDGFNLDVDVPFKEWTTNGANGGGYGGEDSDEGLYPGTQVTSVNVTNNVVNGRATGQVRLNFTSPAAPDKVADYMVNTIRKKGGKATRKANTITATQTDGDNYTVKLEAADGGNKTQGIMVIGKGG